MLNRDQFGPGKGANLLKNNNNTKEKNIPSHLYKGITDRDSIRDSLKKQLSLHSIRRIVGLAQWYFSSLTWSVCRPTITKSPSAAACFKKSQWPTCKKKC